MRNILIIEDDTLLNKVLVYNLAAEGYRVDSAHGCQNGRKLLQNSYELVLLDINLPDGDGISFCREIRERSPNSYIVFLTADDKESDMLKGYAAGGADYITKPFSVAVLIRKLAAVFEVMENRNTRRELYDDGFLRIDFTGQNASLNGGPLEFTPKEYRTLRLFVENGGLILTKGQLLERLWDIDGDFVEEHTLTTMISRIRKKIELEERKYIRTAYGMGYQWIGGVL